MTSTYWIKLYTEILHDPKIGLLPPEVEAEEVKN